MFTALFIDQNDIEKQIGIGLRIVHRGESRSDRSLVEVSIQNRAPLAFRPEVIPAGSLSADSECYSISIEPTHQLMMVIFGLVLREVCKL